MNDFALTKIESIKLSKLRSNEFQDESYINTLMFQETLKILGYCELSKH